MEQIGTFGPLWIGRTICFFTCQASDLTAVAPVRVFSQTQLLIKSDISTETSAPRLPPHFTIELDRWIKAFLAHPYLTAKREE